MNLESAWPDATAVHAALAPAGVLLAERRALYQMAAELFAPGQEAMAPQRLDNPLFRFRIGEALAGRSPFDPTVEDELDEVVTELRSGPMCLRVATGAGANDLLADAMRAIHAQSFSEGRPPRPLTEADGEEFAKAMANVEGGLHKVRELSPRLADDLLPHTGLLVILDPSTSGGLISASSRFFPGLILIDRPASEFDVAEALIHEGAHQKFFDLAITHAFLGADIVEDRRFHPSWSGANWPVDQVLAAFHAYACMAQFAEDIDHAGETRFLGKNSLLLSAREREAEIGRWLLDAESTLEIDARWLLRTFLREDSNPAGQERVPVVSGGHFALDPLLRVARVAASGRVLLARPGSPPVLHWLNGNGTEVLARLENGPVSMAELEIEQAAVLAGLAESALVHRVGEPQ
jgi:hypothetical protein